MSKNYVKVKRYYDSRLWSVAMVHAAVGKWITAEEYTTITGQTYESEEQYERKHSKNHHISNSRRAVSVFPCYGDTYSHSGACDDH